MLESYKKQKNKTQYVKISAAFRKIYLHHHQALYKLNEYIIYFIKDLMM